MKTQILEIFTGRIGLQKRIEAVQHDSGRVLKCVIADMDIPDGAAARIYAIKPSGKEIYNDCEIRGNIVAVGLTTQTLAEVGMVFCQIQIASDGKTVTSFEFTIDVKRNRANALAEESINEYTTLENALNEVENLKKTGLKGDAATIAIVSTKTGEAGTEADVKNIGTSGDAKLEFTIPRGEKGEKGDKGDPGSIENLDEAEITFESDDNLDPENYAEIQLIESGGKLKDYIKIFTTTVKNLRYFFKLMGSSDISSIGDGTVTSALAELNADKLNKTDVINDLLSTAADKALSAAMGKQLGDAVSALNTDFDDKLKYSMYARLNQLGLSDTATTEDVINVLTQKAPAILILPTWKASVPNLHYPTSAGNAIIYTVIVPLINYCKIIVDDMSGTSYHCTYYASKYSDWKQF